MQIVSTLLHFQADFSKLVMDFINDDVTRLLGEVLVDCEAETKSFVLICIFDREVISTNQVEAILTCFHFTLSLETRCISCCM